MQNLNLSLSLSNKLNNLNERLKLEWWKFLKLCIIKIKNMLRKNLQKLKMETFYDNKKLDINFHQICLVSTYCVGHK